MIRTLDIHPALGFETLERWNVAVNQRDEYITQKGANPKDANHRIWGEERRVLNNFSKIAAYIPGLNLIIGIARIILSLRSKTTNPEKKAINARHVYRGIAEIFLGPLLMIPDVVQTIRDKAVVQMYLKNHPGLG